MRRLFCSVCVLVVGLGAVIAQDPFKSGPQVDAVLSGSFDALNINGKVAEGRQHCLICQNALNPAVLIFAREPSEKTEKPLTELLANLDKLVQQHESYALGGFAVFLSPDARSSVNDSDAADTAQLLEEATKRLELIDRLKKRAEPLKDVIIAAYPAAGPKGFNINPKAEVTVILFSKLKVISNWAFAEGKLTDNDAAAILKKVEDTMQQVSGKKKG